VKNDYKGAGPVKKDSKRRYRVKNDYRPLGAGLQFAKHTNAGATRATYRPRHSDGY